MSTKIGTGYVQVSPDFTGFQEKVAAKLNSTLGPAMDKAGKEASKRLSKSIGDNSSLRSSLQPLVRRFQKAGDDAGEELAKRISKGARRGKGDMFGLADAVREVGRRSKETSTISKALANDTFGIAHAARDAGEAYRFGRAGLNSWGKEASKVDAASRRLSKGVTSLFRDFREVGANLKAAAGGFGNFEGIMARANRGFQFFRNILGSLKIPAFAQGVALLAQSLSALTAGAFAAASALGPLTGALVAIPQLALAGAQAIGTLKLAFAGIGDAVKAAVALQVKGGEEATQTLRAQEDAAEAVADAHRSLASAERDADRATTEVTKARREATRQLEDMRRAAEESNLTEREGADALRESRRELAKTLRDPKANGLDIRQAEEAVERAQFALKNTRVEAKRARADYSEAHKKGVEGMPEVVAAKRAEADANRAEAEAERALTKAIRDNNDAMEKQGSAATALQQKMAELTPSGRKFAKFLISLKPRYDELREVASKGFFPGAESGIKSAMKNFGVVKGVIGETSDALGKLAAKAGSKLGSEAWGRDLGKIGETNTRVIERLGQAGLNLGDAFRNILVSARPLIEWMSKGTLKFSEWIKSTAQAERASGGLSHFFEETREAMERVWRILKPLGEGLLAVGHAAKPLGDEILGSLGKAAEGWAKWTKSTEGQNQLKRYFTEVKPAVFAIGRLVRDMTKDFFELGRQKGVSTLVEAIRTKLLPLLTDGAGLITGFTSGFIGNLDKLHKEGVPIFDAFMVTLAEHAADAAKSIAKALVNAFINSSVWGKLAIGGWLISKFGGVGAFASVGKTLGRYLGLGIATTAAEEVAGSGAAGAGGGLIGRLKGIKWGRVAGLGLGALVANSVLDEYKRVTDEHSSDLATALGAKSDTQSGVEKTLTGITNFIGIKGKIDLPSFSQIFGADDEQQAAKNLNAEFEEMARTRVRLSESTIKSLRAQAEEVDLSKEARAQLERMLRIAEQGHELGLKVGLDSEGQVREIHAYLKGFSLLKSGVISRMGDISKVAKENVEHITASWEKGTPKWRSAIVENMKASIDAIRNGMKEGVIKTEAGQKRIRELMRNIRLFEGRDPLGIAKGFSESWAKAGKVTKTQIENEIGELRKLPKGAQEQAREAMVRMARKLESEGKLVKGAASRLNSALTTTFGKTNSQLADSTAKTMAHIAESIADGARNVGKGIKNVFENMAGALEAMGEKKIPKFNVKVLSAASQYHHAREEMPGFQGGGLAAVVPGHSTGDRHVLALGGRPVAKVESGEGIFVGNRKMMAAAKAANDAVPRFQTGGLAKRATGGLVEPKLEGQAGPLRQLGQSAIKKVYEGAKSYLDKHKPAAGAGRSGGPIALSGGLVATPLQFAHYMIQAGFPRTVKVLSEGLGTILSESGFKVNNAQGPSGHIGPWAESPAFGSVRVREDPLGSTQAAYRVGWLPTRSFWQAWGQWEAEQSGLSGGGAGSYASQFEAVAKQALEGSKGLQEGGLLRAATGGLLELARGGGFDPEGRKSKFAPLLRRTAGPMKGTAARALAWAKNNLGTQEGSAKQERWGPNPWCGYFFGADMSAQGVPLPPNPGSTGSYEHEWDNGSDPVGGLGSAQPGDFLGFNGEHTAMYEGHGRMISGNWGDEVAEANVSDESEPLTSVRRPRYPGGSGAPGAAPTTPAAGKEAKPKEKVPGRYEGLSTRSVPFNHPKTLDATEREIDRLVGKDGKGGLRKRYSNAASKAEEDGKPAIAKALQERITSIDLRVKGLRGQRNKLRLGEAKKALKRGIAGKLAKIAGYGQRIEGSKRLYEEASQYAEQVVGLEPESPEIAPEPELPENATDKQRRDAHNAYEQAREGTEKSYVTAYTKYIEEQETPAYRSVLDRVAEWRNDILRAETFGFGKGNPSTDQIERGLEKQARHKIGRIAQINDFTEKVRERIEAYWAKVKDDVSTWRSSHQGQDLPKWLKDERAGLPEWLQKQVEERDTLRAKLPFLRDEKGQLETAIGEAREAFFAGGDNRLVDPPILASLPLPGSGTFEDNLAEVQGLHQFPDQHGLLGAADLAGPNVAGQFGGVIWSVREAIQGLGLKIKQAGSSIQKAQLEGPGKEEEPGKAEREQLLEELLQKANQRLAVQGALEPVLNQFEATYPLPFAGTFHTGGVIGGPSNAEAIAKVRAGEGVFTPEQMAALAPAGEGDGLQVHVNGDIHQDPGDPRDPVEVFLGDRRVDAHIEQVAARIRRPLSNGAPGQAWRR